MAPHDSRGLSRRGVLRSAGGAALAAALAPAVVIPGRAHAAQKTLKILQWTHFVPAFDHWFNNVYAKDWGERNDTRVIVNNVGMTGLHGRAEAEILARKGHDLCMFLRPPAAYEKHVVDLRDVHEECESRYGKPIDLAVKSTFNPKTGKYYGFSDSYTPDPVNYRKDLWDDVGARPDSWDDIRVGGRKILRKHGTPVGIGLAPELDTNMALRSIMAAFGASVQDAAGRPVLRSRATLQALRFVKALYKEAMTDEVFAWDASSNNRHMLAGKGSLALNAVSITRTGEKNRIPVTERIALAPAAAGPVRRIGLHHLIDVYVIWNFAENVEGAKQFLVDYVKDFRTAFVASGFYNFPCYPRTVPDSPRLIAHDPEAKPSDKYGVFADVEDWTANIGYPGHANAAVDEIFGSWHLSDMFAKVARGHATPEDALSECAALIEGVYDTWRARGMV